MRYNIVMLWLQALPAFAIWIAYLYLMRNRVQRDRLKYQSWPRRMRTVAMIFGVLASLAVLIAGALLLGTQKWISSGDDLTVAGITMVTVIGLIYLKLQMIVVSLTLSLAFENVTSGSRAASDIQDNAGERRGEN
ncbi:MAG: hypothetical protein ACR2HJ_11905 [Fimbriimonadales bacterium]